MKRSNKLIQALKLPKVANINPRSAMNKIEELKTFINEENIDIVFVSESHERKDMTLQSEIDLPNFTVVSNLHQRKEKGGRPALIVNHENFDIEDVTNTVIDVPWGVEIVWAVLTPKNVQKESIIQRIVLGSIYVKPGSKKKTATLDHIAQTYNFLNVKYGKGLYWILAGDTNELRLDPILNLHPSLKSVVTKSTRDASQKILDNIITDLHMYYKTPDCLAPLDADEGSKGVPSDHNIVVMEPISAIENKPARITREIVVRPMKQSGIDLFGMWLKNHSWAEVLNEDDVDKKAEIFQNILLHKLDEYLPLVRRKISTADQPFCNPEIKRLKRIKSREYHKHRKSVKWKELNVQYKRAIAKAKKSFYQKIVKDLKTSNTNQWYSKLKRLCSDEKTDDVQIESLKHLSVSEQAEAISDKFAKVSQEYKPIDKDEIKIPEYDKSSIPQFLPAQVVEKLRKLKVKKAVPPGDLPPVLLKTFAEDFSKPLTNIINAIVTSGVWPKLYKSEIVTPVPKTHPPKTVNDLRNISGLLTFNKIAEQLISDLMISDIMKKLDKKQFANQKGVSLQHYLISMIDKILKDTDKRSKNEVNAILAVMVDWKEAFPRQDPTLGVKAFIDCGVRGSLIPLLMNYLQDRSMKVKWKGTLSNSRDLIGGSPQGSTFGIWQYLSQSNDNADSVPVDYRFKFVDDLTILEKINLLMVGLASFNFHSSVSSEIPSHNQFIPPQSLKMQDYLEKIASWTDEKQMLLNKKKTKAMIFNFSNEHQFTTSLKIDDEVLDIVEEAKLLGVIITNDLKWNSNTEYLVKRANSRMELLRRVAEFTTSTSDLKTIYVMYIRSILEQSCVVWHSSLSNQNSEDLERIQKSALKIILGTKYRSYKEALQQIDLESLKERREKLCLRFAEKCIESENPRINKIFTVKAKYHQMNTRKNNCFNVDFARTERSKTSAIPYMQRLLNSKSDIKYQTIPKKIYD